MVADNDAGKEKPQDPQLQKAFDWASADKAHAAQASEELLKAADPNETYKTALKSEYDAESNWTHSLPKGQTALTADQIKDILKKPDLDAQSQGFMHFLQDNFLHIAGVAGSDGGRADASAAKISLGDVVALGAMNEVSPEKMEAGVKFLQGNFFPLSGFDNKVTSERVEKLLYDHSYLLLPQETKDLIYDLTNVVKSSDGSLADFDKGKRTKSGLTEDDAKALKANELTDNLRIQALEKGMFGTALQRLDGKTLGAKAQAQYDEAAKRYKDLRSKGLDDFLSQK